MFDCEELWRNLLVLLLLLLLLLLLTFVDSSATARESIFRPADAAAARVKGGTGFCCVIIEGASSESFSVNDGITSVAFAFFNFVRERRLYEFCAASDDGRTATGLKICMFADDGSSFVVRFEVERVV